jgi:hypothetical protein
LLFFLSSRLPQGLGQLPVERLHIRPLGHPRYLAIAQFDDHPVADRPPRHAYREESAPYPRRQGREPLDRRPLTAVVALLSVLSAKQWLDVEEEQAVLQSQGHTAPGVPANRLELDELAEEQTAGEVRPLQFQEPPHHPLNGFAVRGAIHCHKDGSSQTGFVLSESPGDRAENALSTAIDTSDGDADAVQGATAFGFVFDIAGDGRQVELSACGVDVAVQFGALADQAQACSQQVSASPYQQCMHSQPTTSPSRKGAMALRNAWELAGTLRA